MLKFDKNLIYYKLPPVLYAAAILSLSALSSAPAPDLGISWEDKIYHFLEYFFFGILVFRAFPGFHLPPRRRTNILLLLLFGLCYAGVDEIVQYFVPTRDSAIGDWIADILGYSSSAVVALWWKAKPKYVADAEEKP